LTGRKPADPAARLSLLRAARENAKPDDILSGQTEMAPLLGMSWRNLTKTIDADPDFPVLTRGGEGVPWQFNAVAVIDHLIAKCEAALAERTARAGKMERLSGLRLQSSDDKPAKGRRRAAAAPPPADAPMSSTELREIGQAQLTAHKLKELQGKLVVADPMKRFLADYHSTMQGETLGLLGKIDPGGQLPPAVRLNIEDSMRTLLVNLQSRMDRFLAGYSDRSAA
jgi:hypothetical protein